jgi:O-methyltransferase
MEYANYPSEHVIIPWVTDKEFLKAYGEISGRTLNPITKCYMLYSMVRHILHIPGSMAECGVYKGGTAYLMLKLCNGSRKVYLHDTFSGIPPGDPAKDNRYVAGGDFSDTSLANVMQFIGPMVDVVFRPGYIPKTFSGIEWEQFSFVHIDLDIYQPIMDSLQFYYGRMTKGGVILLDDYGAEECRGAYLAVEEFCALIGRRPIVLSTGQAMIICA